jgi:hypothetical protein
MNLSALACFGFLMAALSVRAAEVKAELAPAIQQLSINSYRWNTEGRRPFGAEDLVSGKKDSTGLTEWHAHLGQKVWTCYVFRGRGAFQDFAGWLSLKDAVKVAKGTTKIPISPSFELILLDPTPMSFPMSRLIDLAQQRTPAAELDWYLDHAVALEVKNDIFILTLSEGTARLAGGIRTFHPFFETPLQIENIEGTLRVWLESGVITRYSLMVRWREDGKAQWRSQDTRIKDVGAINVDIPDEALELLQPPGPLKRIK